MPKRVKTVVQVRAVTRQPDHAAPGTVGQTKGRRKFHQEDENMTPKFTKREQKKLAVVFDMLRAELKTNLMRSHSPYDNDLGCGNCGDTGPFHHLLFRLEQEIGLRKKEKTDETEN